MVPGIIVVVVFAFTLSAHEFIYALAFNKSSAVKTIATGVPTLTRGSVAHRQVSGVRPHPRHRGRRRLRCAI